MRQLEQRGANAELLMLGCDEQVNKGPETLPQRGLCEANGDAAVACDPGAGGIVLLFEAIISLMTTGVFVAVGTATV